MELHSPSSTAGWQALADQAAFQGGFTRAFSGGRRYTQLEAAVLSAAEHRLLTDASAALAAILTRVVEWVQRNPVFLPVLGIPPELEGWITHRPDGGPFAVLARLDWVQDTAGRWWCLECNADTPGGLPEATVWQELACRVHSATLQDPNRELGGAIGAALREWLPGTAGFVTSPGHTEDLENVLAAAAFRGGDYVVGGLPLSAPVDSLYRFYPGDWLWRYPDLLKQLEAGLPCANPGRSLIAQSKAMLALLWHLVEENRFLTPTERDWVTTFLPRTALVPLPGPWLAKPYWEREGAGIVAGEGEGAAHPTYIYQSRVDVARLPLTLETLQGARPVAATPVVGVYLVLGRPSGYLTRIGGPVTDRSAHMLPTLIQAEQ